jgi:hypothetical protein
MIMNKARAMDVKVTKVEVENVQMLGLASRTRVGRVFRIILLVSAC